MRLMSYWWLLFWIIPTGLIFNTFFPKVYINQGSKKKITWSWFSVLILMTPYVIWAGFRSNNFGDTKAYREAFLSAPDKISELSQYLQNIDKDKGFSVLLVLVKNFISHNDIVWFLLIAAFQLFAVAYLYRAYSRNFFISVFLFIASGDYLAWVHNGMRQFLAVSIVLFSFRYIIEKQYIKAVIVILIASCLHGSALIMLPLIFVVQGKAWNLRTVLMIISTIIAVLFIDKTTFLLETVLVNTQYEGLINNYIWEADNGTSMFRAIVYSIPAVLSILGKRYVDAEKDTILNISINCSIVSAALYWLSVFTSGIYIGRLPIYVSLWGYIAIPAVIESMFTEQSSKLVYMSMGILYVIYFYYQLIAWGLT